MTTFYRSRDLLGRLLPPTSEQVKARFWSHVKKTPSCWLWTRGATTDGYGVFSLGLKSVGAHRFSYLTTHGKILEGLQIDHLCRVRHCVNPAHLELVTSRENGLRGFSPPSLNAKKTHCRLGHSLSDCYLIRRKIGGLFRRCKTCNHLQYLSRSQREALSIPGVVAVKEQSLAVRS